MDSSDSTEAPPADAPGGRVRRLGRVERREQILDAATRAFARTGFAATSLDDIAAEAGVTRVLLYRHFDSKADMYRRVLERACERLERSVGPSEAYDDTAIPSLIRAAAQDPDGFRLLFRHAAREPDFRDLVDTLTTASAEISRANLLRRLPEGPWTDWAAQLLPTVAIDAVIAWLDAGKPDPDTAADRVNAAVQGVISAADPNG